MQKLAMIAVLVAVAGVLCGFNGTNFTYDLNAYRGEPVGDAIEEAAVGPFGESPPEHSGEEAWVRSALQIKASIHSHPKRADEREDYIP